MYQTLEQHQRLLKFQPGILLSLSSFGKNDSIKSLYDDLCTFKELSERQCARLEIKGDKEGEVYTTLTPFYAFLGGLGIGLLTLLLWFCLVRSGISWLFFFFFFNGNSNGNRDITTTTAFVTIIKALLLLLLQSLTV